MFSFCRQKCQEGVFVDANSPLRATIVLFSFGAVSLGSARVDIKIDIGVDKIHLGTLSRGGNLDKEPQDEFFLCVMKYM